VELCGHVLHLRLTALVQQKVGLAARLTLLLPVGKSTTYQTDVNLKKRSKLSKEKDLAIVIFTNFNLKCRAVDPDSLNSLNPDPDTNPYPAFQVNPDPDRGF
jgi:hypothetical protein